MPIYEYACRSCEKEFEILRKFSDITPVACPFCNTQDVTRKLSLSAFQLKGNNWYRDGYGSNDKSGTNNNSGATDKSDAVSSSTDKSSDKQDTKKSELKTEKSDTATSSQSKLVASKATTSNTSQKTQSKTP